MLHLLARQGRILERRVLFLSALLLCSTNCLTDNLLAQQIAEPVQKASNPLYGGTNEHGINIASNAPATNDNNPAIEWLKKRIQQDQVTLQNTNLNESSRHFIEIGLKDLQNRLESMQNEVQSNNATVQAISANPAGAVTNLGDPIDLAMSRQVDSYQKELADPALDHTRREAIEFALSDLTQIRDDHRLNAQLWSNVTDARRSRDSKHIAQAEGELADYLAKKLGKMQGKTYPTGMSLEAVMEQYRIQAGGAKVNRRKIVLAALLLVALLPLAAFTYKALRRRKS